MSIVFGNSTGTPVTSTVYTAGNISGDGSIGKPIVLISSPALTGAPTAPTPTTGSNNNYIATTAFVAATVVSYAPLSSPAFTGTPTAPTPTTGDNSRNIATTAFIVTALTLYAPLNSPAFTGTPTAPTAASGTNTTQIATTAFVQTANGAYLPLTGGTLTGNLTVQNGIYTSGNFSAPVWANNNFLFGTGINFYIAPATYTDTTGTGLFNYMSVNQISVPTINASNTVTYTNASTLSILGPPVAGTNVTITQQASLLVYSGLSVFNGGISTQLSPITNNFYAAANTQLYFSNQSTLIFGGASNVNLRVSSNAQTTQTLTTGYGYSTVIIGSAAVTTASTGTHPFLCNTVINTLGTVTSGGATVTNTATLYVNSASLAGTNNYSLYVAGSQAYFGGIFIFSASAPSAFQIPVVNSGVNKMIYVYSGQTNTTLSAINSTGTATAAQILAGTITSTSAAPTTITLDTVSNIFTALSANQGTRFTFNVDNISGASLVTIALPSGMSANSALTGGTSLTITNGQVGQFEIYVHSNANMRIARIY